MPEAIIAFQGEHGAFSEEVALHCFGHDARTLPQPDFAAVAGAVTSGVASHGVLPAENVIHGSVLPVYDVLAEGRLCIVREHVHPIRLALMVLPGVSIGEVRRACSHPVALNQCMRFLREHPRIEAVPFFDTAGAARDVAARGERSTAAVAPAGAARRYGLEILREGVEDRTDNQTRFFVVVAGSGARASATDAASPHRLVLMVDAAHEPGSLQRVLAPLAAHGINLTRIESRPAGEPWSYLFFIEAVAPDVAALDAAVAHVERAARRVLLLGVMPLA